MAKFIRIKDNLINVDKVTNFTLDDRVIWIYFNEDSSNPLNILCLNNYEAALIFEDIPHLIDNNYTPNHVREHQLKWKAQQAEAKAVISTMDDSNWDELPF